MKKILLTVLLFSVYQMAVAQIKVKDIINNANNAINANNLSNTDIIKGLKEALNVGSNNAGNLASKADGFYKNPQIKIPYPAQTRDMMATLKSMGMEAQVKAFEKQLNRAAEDAAAKAAPIFVNAVSSMNINDALGILKGNNDAATQYLKQNTSTELTSEFKPVITASLQKVDITKYWKPLFNKYNQLPFVKKVNPKLEEYVTQKAIDGLFILVAQEELKIRQDPAARVTDILKKVFGAKK
jgi:hypothetical protein